MKQSIKIKFFLCISALVIIAMGTTTIISSINFRNTLNESVNSQMQQLVQVTMNNIDLWIEDKKQDVLNWSDRNRFKMTLEDSYLGRAARENTNIALKERQEKYQCYESLNIANLAGDVIASSNQDVFKKRYNIAQEDFFQSLIKNKKKLFVSPIFKSPVTNENVFVISAPLKKEETTIGVFFVIIDLNFFREKFITPIKITKYGYAYLLHQDGTFLSHPDKTMLHTNIKELPFGEALLKKRNGYMNYIWKGEDKTVYFESNDELGCVLVIGAQNREILAPVRNLRKINYLITALSIIVSLITIAILYQKIILMPMGTLMDGINKFGKGIGNREIKLPTDDEFNELAKAFNEMTKSLKKSTVSIAVLQEEQKRFKNIAQTSGDWIWEIDTDGNFLFSSDLSKNILGYDKNEIMKMNYYELLDTYGRQRFKNLQEQSINEKGSVHNFENIKKDKNNESVFIETNCVPMTNPCGDIIGFRGVDRDITRRKSDEQNLKHAYAELKSTQRQLMQSEKMASIGLLAAGVAHEINNPIGFIMSNVSILKQYIFVFSQLLQKYKEIEEKLVTLNPTESRPMINALHKFHEEKKTDYLLKDLPNLIEETLSGVERIKKIVSALKTFSHSDKGEHQKADINNLINTALNIASNEIKHKAQVIKKLGEIPEIYCYPQLISQMVLNLIINASHALQQRGTITISTEHSNDKIIIKISDTGCGIPKENLSRLYEPFFTTKDVGQGTGLGLSIVYNIIEKHDGTISVESTEGVGTTFTITIPAT